MFVNIGKHAVGITHTMTTGPTELSRYTSSLFRTVLGFTVGIVVRWCRRGSDVGTIDEDATSEEIVGKNFQMHCRKKGTNITGVVAEG